jgi:3-methyladenine DNA glycosylase AlkC
MAQPLKESFDARVVRGIAHDLAHVHRGLRPDRFVAECLRGFDELELVARARRVAEVMHRHLPTQFPAAAEIIVASLGPERAETEGSGMTPFRYLPHTMYVQQHGLDHFDIAMRAQYELTKRFTAEFSIRVFLERHTEATLARLRQWARDDNVHVRRLVSEGTRPRLPWARRLQAFQVDPRPVLELLELLKDDPEPYVQRSVANNLNDIGKDHPQRAVATCRRWLDGATPGRAWIVRHALRSLIKSGHPGALSLLGVGAKPKLAIEAVALSARKIALGGRIEFRFDLVSASTRSQELLVDYAVHYVKANGGTRPKVFKLRRVTLAPKQRLPLGATISFEDLTTRRHYPGLHRIEARINGVIIPLAQFRVEG